MVLPFRDFINNLVGQPVVPAPPLAAPVQPPPQQEPQQQRAATPYVAPPPPPNYQPPVQQAPVQQPAPYQGPMPLTPQQFAQQQGPVAPVYNNQENERLQPKPDTSGAWQTVSYLHEGVQYYILMPVQNTQNLPAGATLVGDPIVGEPHRVEEAMRLGEQDAQNPDATAVRGTLFQMPQEVQGAFLTDNQVRDVDYQNPTPEQIAEQQAFAEMNDLGYGPPPPTTQAPVDEVIQSPEDVEVPPQETPPLTTRDLRAMDSEVPGSAANATLLERAGIFEIPADQMAVSDANGNITLVPASETAPEGMEIITYGGRTEKPEKQGVGDMFSTVMEVLDKPKRGAQSLVADAAMFYAEHTGGSGTAFLTGALGNSPMGDAGLTGFAQWIVENEEAARNAQENGYTAPNGEHFTGNRAMWELFQSERNIVERAIDDVTSDPLNVLPTAGAPVRSAANRIGGIRRGIGYTDEAVEVANPVLNTARRTAEEVVTSPITAEQAATRGVQIADDAANAASRSADEIAESTFANAPQDFANAPRVVDEGNTVINRGRGYIDESFQNNPRTGELITDTPVNPPTSVTDAVLGTTENILNVAADILDIPENILGMMVDRGIITLRQVGEWVAKIPAPDGRNVGDMFRTTDDTIVRDVLEEGEIQTQNVLRQGEDIPLGPTATDLVEPPAPRSATDEIPTVPTATGQQPLDTSALGREAEPLPTDRPIDDLGRPADEAVDRAAQPLAVDRPLQAPEEIATARHGEFLNTPAGQAAKRKLDSWPEGYAYMRPQTAMDRDIGTGRLDEAFTLRPADAAYELAPDRPDQYQRFITDYDRAVRRKTTGYFAQEDARRATKAADLNLTSKRFADQRERGLDVRNMWEVINEADHLVNNELPLFNKYFGDVVDAPEYQWKRWGTAGNSHTAMDLLEQNGGRYVEGMPLGEATEVAIFHPDDATRLSALEDITRRIANRDDAGREIPSRLHSSISHVAGIKNVLSRSRRERRSILNLRDNYQSALQANREMPKTPLPTRDIPVTPARQAAPQVDVEPVAPTVMDDGGEEVFARDLDPEGAAVYDEDLRQSLDQERRATRPTNDLIQDAPPVPEGAAARQNRKYTELDRNTELLDLRRLVDFRNRGQRNLDTTPLSMRERRQQSRREFLGDRAETKAQNIQATGERMNETDLASFYVRGRAVSESQARYFTQKFSDGETLAARWDRYTLEELEHVPNGDVRMAEGLASSRVINDYVAEVMPQKMRTVYDRELNKLRGGRKELEDGTTRTRTELEAQLDAMQKARSTAPNNRFLRAYDRFVSALRQTFLYNWLTGPRYISTQLAGNTITAGVTKHLDVAGDIISGKALREAWHSARNAGEIKSSMLDEVLDGYGLGGQRDITRGTPAIRDQTLEAASNELSRKGGNSLLGKYTNPIADRRIRDMAGAYDRIARESLFAHYMDNNLRAPRATLRDRMMATTPTGMDAADVARIFDEMPSRFSSTDLREAYTGAPSNWIDRHARDWQEALVKTDKAARDEVKRAFFDGSERNADRFFKRTLFFHYWMSRALPLYTEAIARDPVMLYNFSKLLDTMEGDDSLQDSKLLKVMQSPMGYNILIRPTAFFETFATLMEDGGYTPEGESRLGALLRNSPIMVNPLIQGGLNIAGAMGDTFAPDLVGVNKFLQFGGTAVDVLNAEFGWDLPSPRNLQEDTLRNARTFVSQYTGDIPGFNEIPYTDPRGYQENEVRSIVAEIALERGLDLDDPIVQDAMVNPESEMYREAFKRSAYQDAWDIAARIIPVTAILYPKSQLASPRERSQQIGQNREMEQQLGIGTTQETSDLYTERSMIAADSEQSRSMQIWQDEYRNIGTPEQRGAYRFYNNIRFGSVENPIVISGKRYMPEAVNGMEEAERTALADTWATETGNTERIETYQAERKAFREEHPEYAEYVGWQAQQRDFPGGVEAYWQDLIQGNPNAARYYNGLTEEQRQNDMNLTSLDAYFAFQGDNLNYWEPEPIATRTQTPPGPYNPIDGGDGEGPASSGSSSSSRSTPTRDTISQEALEYQQEMDAYNAQASAILGQPIVVDQINPMARNAVVQNLEQAGISRPRMGSHLYGYMQWAEAQGGGDTSIESYLRWYEQQNPPKAEETPAA